MTTKYLVPCSCGVKHPVELTQAGQTLQCPCGRPVAIPTMQQLRRLERQEHTGRVSSSPKSSLWQRLVLLGGAILVVGVGLSAAVYWTRPQWLPYESPSPVEALTIWRLYTREPQIQLSPAEREFITLSRRHARWLGVTLTLTAIGTVVLGLGLLLVGRGARGRPPSAD